MPLEDRDQERAFQMDYNQDEVTSIDPLDE
jgi:hypothetical protein